MRVISRWLGRSGNVTEFGFLSTASAIERHRHRTQIDCYRIASGTSISPRSGRRSRITAPNSRRNTRDAFEGAAEGLGRGVSHLRSGLFDRNAITHQYIAGELYAPKCK